MSVEGGPSGGISGGTSGGMGAGVGGGVGVGIGGGAETGGVAGAASVSGLARFGSGPAFGAAPVVVGPVNEGPVGLADLKATVPWQAEAPKSLGELLSEDAVVAEAESILARAKKPAIFSPVTLIRQPAEKGISPDIYSSPAKPDQNDKMIEPMVVPFPVPNNLEFPQPQVAVSPAVEPLVQPGLQIENQVFNEVKPIVLTQPALEEQETQQEMVMKRVTAKRIDIGEEEKEEVRLKNVVDKKILETRIGEFGSAADRVEAKAKESDLEEIDGKEIVEQVPVETEEKRSGLVKKSGPDGSRVETIEEVASRKFKSVKEAKDEIMAIIFKKPPVKKEKEGEEVGQEAVARVLKYRMAKSAPEAHAEVVKRENTLEDLGLAEVFPKAA